MIFRSLSLAFFSSVAVANGDVHIGGNHSFNGNHNNVSINVSNQVSDSQFDIQKRVLERRSEVTAQAFDKSISDTVKSAIIHELALLDKAEAINKQQLATSQKQELCKQEADIYISVFGHQAGFSYSKCQEIFQVTN
jgi:hypothetical protein